MKKKLVNYRNTLNLDIPISELTSKSEDLNRLLDEKLAALNSESESHITPLSLERSNSDLEFESGGGSKTVSIDTYKQKVINGVLISGTQSRVNVDMRPDSIPSWVTSVKESPAAYPLKWNYRISVNPNSSVDDRKVQLVVDQDETYNSIPINITQKGTPLKIFKGIYAKSWDFSGVNNANATFTLNEAEGYLIWENPSSLQIHANTGEISKVIWANKIKFIVDSVTPSSGYTKSWKPNYIIGYEDDIITFRATPIQQYTSFEYNDNTMNWSPFQTLWSSGGATNYQVNFSKSV